MRCEFSYVLAGRNRIRVAANSNVGFKTIAFAKELEKKLRLAIPFPFRRVRETEINIVGGDRARGMLRVEMVIMPNISIGIDKMVAALDSRCFVPGLEPCLK
jgi:hypothetical protein